MDTRILASLASSLHILGIVIMAAGTALRAWYFRGPWDEANIRRLSMADSASGLGAMFVMGSGLWRLFGALDKGIDFYVYNGMFWAKMGLLAAAMTLEMFPQWFLAPWQFRLRPAPTPATIDVALMQRLAKINLVELVLFVGIVLTAPMMARGLWLLP